MQGLDALRALSVTHGLARYRNAVAECRIADELVGSPLLE
jgi:hypothetical protein